MAINTNLSIGQKFNNWTISVSKNVESASPFEVSSTTTDTNKYIGDFVELTKSHIAEYDTDGDDAISFEEFKTRELQIAKDNNAEEPDESTLKLAFDRLNVVKDGEYGDKLSQKEVFSYFTAIDALENADGKFTASEYAMMALSLQDSSKDEKSPGGMVSEYLKNNYKNIFDK